MCAPNMNPTDLPQLWSDRQSEWLSRILLNDCKYADKKKRYVPN